MFLHLRFGLLGSVKGRANAVHPAADFAQRIEHGTGRFAIFGQIGRALGGDPVKLPLSIRLRLGMS